MRTSVHPPPETPSSFQIRALSAEPFAPLFARTDDELRARGAVRQTVDRTPGFPCRVSLADAEPGETVVLVHYEHQAMMVEADVVDGRALEPAVARLFADARDTRPEAEVALGALGQPHGKVAAGGRSSPRGPRSP